MTTRPDASLVSYWWFYGYNKSEFHGSHQGDWEHVTLKLNPSDLSLAGAWLARHGGGTYHPASELELRDGHPVIYSVLGAWNARVLRDDGTPSPGTRRHGEWRR